MIHIVAACFTQFIRGLFLSMYIFPIRSMNRVEIWLNKGNSSDIGRLQDQINRILVRK
jgi:hypothetical protein